MSNGMSHIFHTFEYSDGNELTGEKQQSLFFGSNVVVYVHKFILTLLSCPILVG